MTIPLCYLDPALTQQATQLAERWSLPVNKNADSGLVLWLDAQGLALKTLDDAKMGAVRVNFASEQMQWRRQHGGGKKESLARAVGLKGNARPSVLDATAGLGRDGFLLASLGCTVTMLERTPEVAALLDDGLKRACEQPELATWLPGRLTLIPTSAFEIFQKTKRAFDVVYLDPMFPHRKKSALVKKEMRLFQQLLGPDEDADALLHPALQLASQRVVVKRPTGAPYLAGEKPDVEMKGKANRFDIYLIANRN
ncbi:16S rRNA (guanine(1516)-N(2))-methyltransferase [Saliniradius amylolyticus]|uniref:Ribosomal RNA small subunit methyltransferase J n=1 Tax=Saliniradius amylolyticus TaxID=2183582 RepID=A0A2S2E6S5_9ALTE|nr:class I SAM-dependent methyltransferase [Saliniradius amylolyticus]AWL13351.1 16S rRNA (guanine(1516)-N(2))-methyltransferase [Saliniradius amylolyticus]